LNGKDQLSQWLVITSPRGSTMPPLHWPSFAPPRTREFAGALLTFLREKVPQNWAELSGTVTDHFRVINPKDFRVLT
jgi:hypothetical protein